MRDGKLLKHICRFLVLLPDIICFSACNRMLKNVGTGVVHDRWDGIIGPFVCGHLVEFRHVMRASQALITGSCALAMLIGGHVTPQNLNIVVPEGSKHLFHSFLVEDLRYGKVQQKRPNKAFGTSVKTFTLFRRRGKVITVSEASSDGPFKAIVTSQTTADMLCMTPGGLVTFYPDLTINRQIAVKNNTLRRLAPSQWVGCITSADFPLYEPSNFINGPCGPRCPALWRKVADDGEETLMLQWDSRFSIKHQVRTSRLLWRLTGCCRNVACMSNQRGRLREKALPWQPMPSTMNSIALEECRIANHRPVSLQSYLTWHSITQ